VAWIDKRRRSDGGVSARVVWRLGGTRDGAYQAETFSIGSDAQNLARADGFKKMVDAAGQRWPDGWVKGEGFVRASGPSRSRLAQSVDERRGRWWSRIVCLALSC
jgi:hypothetical protein